MTSMSRPSTYLSGNCDGSRRRPGTVLGLSFATTPQLWRVSRKELARDFGWPLFRRGPVLFGSELAKVKPISFNLHETVACLQLRIGGTALRRHWVRPQPQRRIDFNRCLAKLTHTRRRPSRTRCELIARQVLVDLPNPFLHECCCIGSNERPRRALAADTPDRNS